MLISRSVPECRLYMDLRPCPACGSIADQWQHRVIAGPDGALVAVYEAPCGGCGRRRRFDFELDPAAPPLPPAYGGDTPSRIICPGQFALTADRYAASLPMDSRRAAQAERPQMRARLEQAIAAQAEILKFIPDGADAVPAEAFVSEEGRSLYAEEPGRFRRARLTVVLDAYRAALRDLSTA